MKIASRAAQAREDARERERERENSDNRPTLRDELCSKGAARNVQRNRCVFPAI